MTLSIGKQSIEQAAGGNSALRDILTKIATVSNKQATKSTNYAGTPKQPAGTVKFANPNFIVALSTLGLPTSSTQASQQAALGANAKAKTTFSQVRASTNLLFGSDATTFGGDAGTAQSELICAGLDTSQSWFFQARSSYDGQTWNSWKNLNGGKPVNGNPNGVELLAGNGAAFSLAGLQRVTLTLADVFDQGLVAPLGGPDIEHTLGIPAPNGYQDAGTSAQGINCSIDATGKVTMTYDGSGAPPYSGSATALLLGWLTDSTDTAPTVVAVTGGDWVLFDLPGGTRIAFGSGNVASGSAFGLPPGFSTANMMAMATPASATGSLNDAHGVSCSVTAATPTIDYADGSGNHWAGLANWFAVAWSPARQANVQTNAAGKFLVLSTPSGKLCFGIGKMTGGSVVPLPAGFQWNQGLDGDTIQTAIGFAGPASFYDAGNHMHGIQLCSVDPNGTLLLVYADGEGHQWSGDVNFFAFAWA